MLNFYNHKDKVIVHNDSNSSWICISPKETEEIKNYIKNPSIKMDTYLEKLTNLYQIFQESEAKIESIFDELIKNGITTVVFTGGEVGEKKDFDKIILAASNKGLKCNLITNGTLIYNKKKAEYFTKICNKITISLDSLYEDENDKNRGKGCYRLAKRAIDNLLELNYSNIAINQTVTKVNYDSLQDMDNFARENGIQLNTGAFCEMGRGKEANSDYSLTLEQRLILEKYTIKNKAQLSPFDIKLHCGQGISEFSINPIGNVYTCKLLDTSDFLLGNLRVDNLKSIFEIGEKKIDQKRFSVFGNEKCRNCSFRLLCGASCRATHYYGNNQRQDDYIFDEECMVIKEMLKEHMYNFFEEV
ncbi:radical SAM protein [Enterococcus durans]|uniref:Radical SAM protein n=1 Tax=Enterococcus durans TaxID=53345 RepID=A0A377KLG1_9ENTE|nr:radical SAM protein [Enterococcus durans]STP29926.1 radical SAM protein [Enterococcus durans]